MAPRLFAISKTPVVGASSRWMNRMNFNPRHRAHHAPDSMPSIKPR